MQSLSLIFQPIRHAHLQVVWSLFNSENIQKNTSKELSFKKGISFQNKNRASTSFSEDCGGCEQGEGCMMQWLVHLIDRIIRCGLYFKHQWQGGWHRKAEIWAAVCTEVNKWSLCPWCQKNYGFNNEYSISWNLILHSQTFHYWKSIFYTLHLHKRTQMHK